MTLLERLRVIKDFISFSKYGFRGNYTSWDTALNNSSGYDADNIVEKVKEAALKVKNGSAVYERDSLLFDKIEYSWPLIALLLWIANDNNSRLKVVDFGGSLGSSYYQNKGFLNSLNYCEWCIVEQGSFVKIGKELIEDEKLKFFYSINEVLEQNGKPDVILLGCTLPYIKDPYALLDDLISRKIKYIIIDNTFFNYVNLDRICIQTVNPVIYKASYPCWILNYKKVVECLKTNYKILAEYKNESFMFLDGRKIQYKGLIAKLNESEA